MPKSKTVEKQTNMQNANATKKSHPELLVFKPRPGDLKSGCDKETLVMNSILVPLLRLAFPPNQFSIDIVSNRYYDIHIRPHSSRDKVWLIQVKTSEVGNDNRATFTNETASFRKHYGAHKIFTIGVVFRPSANTSTVLVPIAMLFDLSNSRKKIIRWTTSKNTHKEAKHVIRASQPRNEFPKEVVSLLRLQIGQMSQLVPLKHAEMLASPNHQVESENSKYLQQSLSNYKSGSQGSAIDSTANGVRIQEKVLPRQSVRIHEGFHEAYSFKLNSIRATDVDLLALTFRTAESFLHNKSRNYEKMFKMPALCLYQSLHG